MKKRRLPETDLANLAFLPEEQKRKFLVAWLAPKRVQGSYDPQRLTMADAVNKQLPLAPNAEQTSWETLEDLVRTRCRGDELLLAMNLPVAQATHLFATEKKIRAFPLHARPLQFPGSDAYEFSIPMIITYDDRPRIVFLDLRRTGGLSHHGRRVVMSAQHVRIRERFPELSDATLESWRYRNNASRSIDASEHGGEHLYAYDELAKDFADTYRIMNELRYAETAETRAANDGDLGPLFGQARS